MIWCHNVKRGKYCIRNIPTHNTSLSSLPVSKTSVISGCAALQCYSCMYVKFSHPFRGEIEAGNKECNDPFDEAAAIGKVGNCNATGSTPTCVVCTLCL